MSAPKLQVEGVKRKAYLRHGDWVDAELADAISADTWRQWSLPWEAAAGRHTLTVRATDARGRLQISDYADVVPDGATGLHSIVVDVG